MPPRSVYSLKTEALLQACNFLSPDSIITLKDLADGKVLQSTICNNFQGYSEEAVTDANVMVVDVHHDFEDDDSATIIPESASSEAEMVSDRFKFVQKFIDDHYNLISEDIVSYDKCIKGCELELAKVCFFIMSEIVRHLAESGNDIIQTLFHLELKHQEELEECFMLFISEREKISKQEIERVLAKSVKNENNLITPRRTCSSKYMSRGSPGTPLAGLSWNEEVFTNSPLKSYFESPVFRKEDIMVKEKEIEHMKKILQEEDEQTVQLHLKIQELEKQLEELEKENKILKKKLSELQSEIHTLCTGECNSALCREEKRRLLAEAKMYKKEVAHRNEMACSTYREIRKIESQKPQKTDTETPKAPEPERPRRTRSLSSKYLCDIKPEVKPEVINLRNKVWEMEQKLQLAEERNSFFKKRLSDALLSVAQNEPGSPGDEENVGAIFQAENKQLQAKLEDAEKQNQELLTELNMLKEQIQNNAFSSSPSMRAMPKLIEVTDEFEVEKLRTSMSFADNSKAHCSTPVNQSFTLEKSDTTAEQPSLVQLDDNSENQNVAVLWNQYDSELASQSTSVAQYPESHLDLEKDYEMDCGVEEDIQDVSENDNLSHNLNFDAFLNSLKRLSTNGSYKKVLDVLENMQSDLNLKKTSVQSGCNSFDLQKLLNIITECISVVSPSHASTQDTSSVSSTNHLESENAVAEVIQLKLYIKELTDQHAAVLKEKDTEKDKMKNACDAQLSDSEKEKNELKSLCEDHQREIVQLKSKCEEFQAKAEEIDLLRSKYAASLAQKKVLDQKIVSKSLKLEQCKQVLDDERKEKEQMLKHYCDYKDQNKKLREHGKKKLQEIDLFRSKMSDVIKENKMHERIIKQIRSERETLKDQLQQLKMEMEQKECALNAVQEKMKDNTETEPCVVVKEEEVAEEVEKDENNPNNTESLSYAFTPNTTGIEYKRSKLFRKKVKGHSKLCYEDEDSFFHTSCVYEHKKGINEIRAKELIRRNSILPRHLQCGYPIEQNLPSPKNLYCVSDQVKAREEKAAALRANAPKRKRPSTETPIVDQPRSTSTPRRFSKFVTPKKMSNLFRMRKIGTHTKK